MTEPVPGSAPAGPVPPGRGPDRHRGPIPLDAVADIVRTWPSPVGYGPYISGKWGVPLATARRWVYQARRAGLLEPGTADRTCRACGGSGVTRWWRGNTNTAATGTAGSEPERMEDH